MARQKEFDRDQALEGAIDVFWRHGFDGTSTGMLVEGMGIGRQSLYDTFGDKRRLYLEALRRYNDASIARTTDLLKNAASPLAGIRAVLEALIAVPDGNRAKGCFGVNATCEHGTADAEVAAIIETSWARLHAIISRTIETGQQQGDIATSLSPDDAIAYLKTLMAGLQVMSRGGADDATLDAALTLGLRALNAT